MGKMLQEILYYLKRPYHFVKTGLLKGLPAQIKYHFPAKKLKIVAITGTDGKTTSSTLLYTVLKQAGKKVALLTTVAAYIGTEEIDTGFHVTTPDPAQLQKFMAKMVAEGYEYLVLETTSHGIYQYRIWGIEPMIVGITNITHEHLDYHVTYDLYLQAKAELAQKAQKAVINADDEMSFAKLRKILKNKGTQVLTYSQEDKLPTAVEKTIKNRFAASFNRMNARMVYTIAHELGIADQDIAQGITEFTGIPGRIEEVGEAKGIKVIVDFAHTPNGLFMILSYLREKMKVEKRSGRLIAVYGSAGLRDHEKRPEMGRVGAALADLAVFTAEDPRTEQVWSIIRQMKQNLGTLHSKVLSIADRREAIFFAITELARSGDIVVICGKGHEKSMCYGKTEYPWSDQEVAQEALKAVRTQGSKAKK